VIRDGEVYIACSMNLSTARFVRITGYQPGQAEVPVEDAETGRRERPIPAQLFYDSPRTSKNQFRRLGYAYLPDGVTPWAERIATFPTMDTHAARRLPIGTGLLLACKEPATPRHTTVLDPAATLTCAGCADRISG